MKKITTLLCIQWLLTISSYSQNIGIGNTNPGARLDINGDIAIRSADIIISTTYNYDLDVNTAKQACYKLKNSAVPVGNFILAGIASGADGRVVTLMNRTGSSMEIYNDDTNAATANRILTGTGSNLSVFNNGTVVLQYDLSQFKWVVTGMHNNSLNYFGGGGSGTSYWDLTGSDIKNNNTGNVGIGATPSGAYKLRIGGNIYAEGNLMTSDGLSVNGGAITTYNNNVSGIENMVIDGRQLQAAFSSNFLTAPKPSTMFINPFGGNVGIRTNTANATLTVSRGTGIDGTAAFFGTTHVSHFNFSTNEDTYIRGGKNGSKVIINDNNALGNVGIGLSNPRCRLTILSNTIAGNNNTEVLQVAGKNAMAIFSNENGADYGYIKAVTDNSQTPQFPRAGLEIGTGPGDLYFTTNYTPILMINGTTNNVGIGTSTPNEKLSVNGNIRSKEVVVELANWPDYVFDKSYELTPLIEVENFIKANNHLPNIPSANEIENNGLKVGDVQKRMMEKIEELTLYVIELKKEIELLKSK